MPPRELPPRADALSLDHPRRIFRRSAAGERYWNAGRVVMRHTQKTVTFVSTMLHTPTSTESPAKRSAFSSDYESRETGAVSRTRTGHVRYGLEKGLEANASNDAGSVPVNGDLKSRREGGVRCQSYKPPVMNNAHNSALAVPRSCKSLITNNGAIKIAKSVRTHGIGANSKTTRRFPHRWGISGSQLNRMGEHMKAKAVVMDIHHKSTIKPRIRTVIRNVRVIKMR